MEILASQRIWTYDAATGKPMQKSCGDIRKSPSTLVENFMDLACKVATLQYYNSEHILLFRGQSKDYKTLGGYTSIKPSILRASTSSFRLSDSKIVNRFDILDKAETILINVLVDADIAHIERIKRHKIIRWAILQHYEVCRTPLLDLTHSLRTAASFCADGDSGLAFIYVLAFPHISGAVTVSAANGIQIVRLASVCPPEAIRPHIQEGYLAGEYPDLDDYNTINANKSNELDFGRRLVAKFHLDPDQFWESSGSFPRMSNTALYPNASRDLMRGYANTVKDRIEAEYGAAP